MLRCLILVILLSLTPTGDGVAKESAKNTTKVSKTKKATKATKKSATKKKVTKKKSTTISKKKKAIQKKKSKKKTTKSSKKKSTKKKAKIKKKSVLKKKNLSDHDIFLEIAKFSSQRDWNDANKMIKQAKDKKYAGTLFKALKIYYEPENLTLVEKSKFFTENSWIPRDPFDKKIESSISTKDSKAAILQWFKDEEPKTKAGKLALLDALIKSNQLSISNKAIKSNLRQLWRTTSLDLEMDEYYLKRYKDHLTVEDLLDKIEHLTWNKSYKYAGRLLSIVPAKYKKLPKTRLEIARSKLSHKATLKRMTGEIRNDDFITYLTIKNLLREDRDKEAINKLTRVRPKSQYEKWWKLKHISIRNALREKQYKQAYILTLNHNLPYGADMADAEWIGGWISLRFLDDPIQAIRRFKKLYDNTKLANSRSKASYWLARSYEDIGEHGNANTWYEIASKYKGTFYGQLAIAKQSPYGQHNYFEDVTEVSYEDPDPKHNVAAKKIAYLSYILNKANIKILSNKLIQGISALDIDQAGLETSAKYFIKLNRHDLAVELSRTSSNRGMSLIDDGYPRHIKINSSKAKFPKALYLSIIRQESRFDQSAKSPAGARGLMQLMPATASIVAKSLGMSKKSYITSGEANVKHGVAYFDKLYDRFENIPMAIAAYNAGPGNVSKWIDRYGDPRSSKDPEAIIDWIEMIPFSETRNYVRKVMENYVVYNSILNSKHSPQDIVSFLGGE